MNDYQNLIKIYVNDPAIKEKILATAKEIVVQEGLTVENARFKYFVRMNLIAKSANDLYA